MKNRGMAVLLIGVLLLAGLLIGCAKAAETTTLQPTAPPAAREPKRLEVKMVIEMGDIFFADENGVKRDTFSVPAGKTVGIHIVNNGAIEHEIMFGRELMDEAGVPHGYMASLLEDVPADVFVYPSGKKIEVETEGMIEEIELEPGADIWLRVKFPESAKGTWAIGCFVPGHYEAGMQAEFIVE